MLDRCDFMGKYEDLNNKLNKYLRLATFLIGVKLLKEKLDIESFLC